MTRPRAFQSGRAPAILITGLGLHPLGLYETGATADAALQLPGHFYCPGGPACPVTGLQQPGIRQECGTRAPCHTPDLARQPAQAPVICIQLDGTQGSLVAVQQGCRLAAGHAACLSPWFRLQPPHQVHGGRPQTSRASVWAAASISCLSHAQHHPLFCAWPVVGRPHRSPSWARPHDAEGAASTAARSQTAHSSPA